MPHKAGSKYKKYKQNSLSLWIWHIRKDRIYRLFSLNAHIEVKFNFYNAQYFLHEIYAEARLTWFSFVAHKAMSNDLGGVERAQSRTRYLQSISQAGLLSLLLLQSQFWFIRKCIYRWYNWVFRLFLWFCMILMFTSSIWMLFRLPPYSKHG